MDHTTEFSKNELLFLKDQLSVFAPGPENGKGPYPELLLKIGAALLEFHDSPSRSNLQLTVAKEELWMIWEVAKSFATVGAESVGYNLTIKAAQGLQQVYADSEVHALLTQFGETEAREPGKAAYRDKLQRIKGGYDYGRDNKGTGSPHYDPSGSSPDRS